jgi:hypothetical protein
MDGRRSRARLRTTASLAVLSSLMLSACASAGAACTVPPVSASAPQDGALLGVNLDWGTTTLADYAAEMGRQPAVAVSFTGYPLGETDLENLQGAADQVRPTGGTLLLTLEPHEGLAAVTVEAAEDLADTLAELNASGVPVIVRFAHEMNGSWYPWGQQPEAYRAGFRSVASAVHATAHGSAMMWAPNYGGGYPFSGGHYQAPPSTVDAIALDTNADGAVTGSDDPYAPYYPGDDAVDWVGMSLYHWGSAYPWGENELPEDGKFAAQLAGTYVGLGGDDTAVPDFYAEYAAARLKPLAIPETAALVVEQGDAAGERAIKQAWWRQVLSADTLERFPLLKMVNWFEWEKEEVEVSTVVDWRAGADEATRSAFSSDLSADWRAAPGASTRCSG